MDTIANKTQIQEPIQSFISVISSVYPVSPEAIEYVSQKANQVQLKKGTLLVASGEHCDHFFFVCKGILRGFLKQGKKDITTWITAEFEMVTSISSFYRQVPSIENIEALEDCILVSIHRKDLEYLYEFHPEVNVLVRLILEKYYQDAEERAFIARLLDASAKYKRFINTQSSLLNRIPLKFIASYLGMTLETLSRIRSKLTKHPKK